VERAKIDRFIIRVPILPAEKQDPDPLERGPRIFKFFVIVRSPSGSK
jgi:hypothetical protein